MLYRPPACAFAGLLLLLSSNAIAAGDVIWLLSEPWPAPFSVEDLASALRLRLRGLSVRLAAQAPRDTAAPIFGLVEGTPVRMHLVRRGQVLLDAPLPERGEGGARR